MHFGSFSSSTDNLLSHDSKTEQLLLGEFSPIPNWKLLGLGGFLLFLSFFTFCVYYHIKMAASQPPTDVLGSYNMVGLSCTMKKSNRFLFLKCMVSFQIM